MFPNWWKKAQYLLQKQHQILRFKADYFWSNKSVCYSPALGLIYDDWLIIVWAKSGPKDSWRITIVRRLYAQLKRNLKMHIWAIFPESDWQALWIVIKQIKIECVLILFARTFGYFGCMKPLFYLLSYLWESAKM